MNEECNAAIQLARQAGEILRRGWGRRDYQVESKGETNPVTEIDFQSEALVTAGLREAFPGYGILAEEGTARKANLNARWIIDPLDGTVNYISGIPMVAVSIGLEKEGELVLGVIYNPITDELFVGEHGKGATLNGMPIHVSNNSRVGDAILASGFPYDVWTSLEDNTREWTRLAKSAMSLRCDGSAALDLCQVACGRLDGYWEKGVSPWDIAAGSVIVREAGGWVGDYQGGAQILERREVVAANPALAQELLLKINS